MDLGGYGALAGGVAALLTSIGAVLRTRRGVEAHLANCEERLVDAETTIGILLSLMPGGELAERYERYRQHRDPGLAELLDNARRRHTNRLRRYTEERGFDPMRGGPS